MKNVAAERDNGKGQVEKVLTVKAESTLLAAFSLQSK